MASNESPSYFLVSSNSFDGTSALTAIWAPNPSPKSQARSYVFQAALGRLSYADLAGPGSLGQLVRVRTYEDSAGLTARVVSANSTENTDVPDPSVMNSVLETIAVTTVWSAPFHMGPTDALAFSQSVARASTVEIMTVGMLETTAAAYMAAGIIASATAPGAVSVRSVTVSETMPVFSGSQYLLGNAAATSMTITLPLASSVSAGTKVITTRVGGGWIAVAPQGGDTINGAARNVIINDLGQVVFEQRGSQWIASDAPITADVTLTNAVADTVVALPIATGTTLVNVSFTARGQIVAPAIADVAVGVEYLIQRTADGAGVSPVRVELAVPAGVTVNGLASGTATLSNPGSILRVRRAGNGYIVTSDRQSTPTQVLAAIADLTIDSGWAGEKVIRATQGAAQTITLPATSLVRGMTVKVLAAGAGGLTINGNGLNIVGATGAASSVLLWTNETGLFTYDGTAWQFMRSLPTLAIVASPADAPIAEKWHGFARIYLCSQAGAQVMTLPNANTCPVGMEVQFVCLGAGGLTVNGGGANIVGAGASAATKAIATNTNMRLVGDGVRWLTTV